MNPLAIYYEPSAYNLKGKVMGRQSAGLAFMRALAKRRPERLWCFSRSRDIAVECAQALADLGSRTGVAHIPFTEPSKLAEAGLLYRPDPGIEHDAWRRLRQVDPRAYSICGITHTTASHAVMDVLAGLPAAPLEDWDALICTSRAVRDSVRTVVENQTEYLRERLGASRFTLPQLPVIPLGVHCDDYVFSDTQRVSAREALGIMPDELVVLFVGRLVFHGKAHPVPLYQALEACAGGRKLVLLQAGWFPSDAVADAYKADAAALCPSVRYLHLDGRDQDRLRMAWAAGDIFTSLSDNIQETFGLTPIEAMAAGLPVIVTDWDGYRDTVRDGIDGYCIPTLTLPAGLGIEFADRFDLGLDNYDQYCGYTSQFVAADIDRTIEAFERLIASADLRQTMGEAGRRRAREHFDWAVIFGRYEALWADLTERRRSNARLAPQLSRRYRPERPDPFDMFASYPTYQLDAKTRFSRRSISIEEALARRELKTTVFAKVVTPSPELIELILEALGTETLSVAAIAQMVRGARVETVAAALVWLSKMGVTAAHRS